MPEDPNKLTQFWQELKRRKVVRVITIYAAAAFVIIELINNVYEPLRLPVWTPTLVIVLLCVGFIITVIVSWVYDITPEGIEKTDPAHKAKEVDKPVSSNSWKIASFISFVVIVALILFHILSSSNSSSKITNLETSIAVLPFENMSDDSEFAHLGDAMTDEIIMQLYKINEFEVRSQG
jgi:energy-coupling factor transporter transmembrane protein EcfT